jgi:EAL domain-containing protein (putative c-di-GMP-specific phosphodiesterase class I)
MDAKKAPAAALAIPEEQLLEYVVRVGSFAYGRTALHIHISALMVDHRKDHNVRIAAHMFDTYLGRSEGELYELTNGDFFFVSRDVERTQLQRLIDRLRGLFSEDPLVAGNSDGHHGFCTWYDLGSEYTELLQDVKVLAATARQSKTETNKAKQSLDPNALVQLAKILSTANISTFIRNQPICLATDLRTVKPIFDELYVSIEDLRAKVCPEHSLTGDKWLFQYITQILDRRMLQHLSQNDHELRERVISINLNISTILSEEFFKFDSSLTAKSRGGRLVIEIQKHDIFADMGAYVFAEQYLHERTHRLSLDGITYQTLPFIDQAKLKLDFVKLGWSPEILAKRDLILGPLKDHINRIGPEHIILMYCDSQPALEIGHELGITRFQGRYISSWLQKMRSLPSTR